MSNIPTHDLPGPEAPALSIGASAERLKATADELARLVRTRLSRGFILWFTGLSGSGKSTLAQSLRLRLLPARRVEVIDGDEVRMFLSPGLGFSRDERYQNMRRIGYVSRVLARHGVIAISAGISPFAEIREEVRRLAEADETPFIEVYARAELATLVERDEKGLYRRAMAGELKQLPGVNDVYDAPVTPSIVVDTARESVAESVERILMHTISQGLLRPEDISGVIHVERDH